MFDTGLKKAVLGQYNLDRYDFYLISKGYISKPPFQSEAKCEAIDMNFFFILMQMKLVYNITRKILHLTSFPKREF